MPNSVQKLAAKSKLARSLLAFLFWLRQVPESLRALRAAQPVISTTRSDAHFAALPFTGTITMAAPGYRAELTRWLENTPAGAFVDIGAETGALTYRSLVDGSSTQAVSFTANPALYGLLVKNIADNDLEAEAVNAAAGAGQGSFNLRPHAIRSGHTSSCSGKSSVRVPTVAVDNYLVQASINPEEITLIHLGSESHTLNALVGAQKTLAAMPAGAQVMVDMFAADAAAGEVHRLLEKYGFSATDRRGQYELFIK